MAYQLLKSTLGVLEDGGARVALWEKNKAHPHNAEVFVAGERPGVAGDTHEVQMALAQGRVETMDAPPAPTLTALEPNTAVLGTADITMVCAGTGFIKDLTIIVFNGYEEPTTWIDDQHISTGVKPSIFTVAEALPVMVRTPGFGDSDPIDFTFTAAAGGVLSRGAQPRRRGPHGPQKQDDRGRHGSHHEPEPHRPAPPTRK